MNSKNENEPSKRTIKAVQLTAGIMLETRYAEINIEWDPKWDDRITVTAQTATEGTWYSPGTFGSDYGDWHHNLDGIFTVSFSADDPDELDGYGPGMKYITMTVSGIYGSTITATSDEEARTILTGPNHYEEILDIQEAFNTEDIGADFIVVVAE